MGVSRQTISSLENGRYIGVILMGCSMFEIVDEYWSGMGTALLVVGVIFLARQFKYFCISVVVLKRRKWMNSL